MTAYELAAKFARRLSEVLTDDELAQVVALNDAETNPNICHSHDFYDANQAMIDVLEVCGIEFDPQDEKQGALLDKAWGIANVHGFDVEDIRNSEALGN